MNDFYRLIERSPQRFRATWWLDSAGKISGFLFEPRGAVVPGDRFDEFKAWARKEKPAELEYLMPGGRFDPDGRPPAALRGDSRRVAQGGGPAARRDVGSRIARGGGAEAHRPGLEARLARAANRFPAQTGGRPIELRFGDDGKVQGSAGCNRLTGAYTVAGAALKFGPLAVTRMACPAMDLERRFLEALDATARWKIVAGALELSDAAGTPLATFRGQP